MNRLQPVPLSPLCLVYKHQPVPGGVLNPLTGEGSVGALGAETIFWGMTRRENQAEPKRLDGDLEKFGNRQLEEDDPYLMLEAEKAWPQSR